MTSVSTEAQPPPRRPRFTSSTTRSSWPGTRIQLKNKLGWDATHCSTVCVGSRRQVRIEWDGSSLVRWNDDPARVEAVLRLFGHTPEGLFLAHVMMRW